MRTLVSAGPTREPLDPVRFISNRSSGRMGYAIAAAAITAGHEVMLVSGPVSIPVPEGLTRLMNVQTAAEMSDAVKSLAPSADLIFMCAGVADYRPVSVANSKMKKSDANMAIVFEPCEDILASLGEMKREGQTLVGFAAETEELDRNALDKMRRKRLDWIVANEVGRPDRGFESELNAATLHCRDGRRIQLPLMPKPLLAERILSAVMGTEG